jgi:two-component sensor histidine kinase
MARTHEALSSSKWTGLQVSDLLRLALTPFARPSGLRLDGPPVFLAAGMAQDLALALHELGVNAAKYGAFSRSTGQVSVTWSADNGALRIRWTERGGPPITPPVRRGLGTTLVEGFIQHNRGGTVQLEFNPEGVECTLAIPLAGRVS